MAKSIEEIAYLLHQRKKAAGPVLSAQMTLRDHVNGDILLPLPELDRVEKPAVANLIVQGLNQTAMRIASTMPDVYFPPVKSGKNSGEDAARISRQATLGWWEQNRMRIKLRRRARYLIGYGTSPVMVIPNLTTGVPEWRVRDPLGSFPCPTADLDEITPPDCIFTFSQTWGWLKARYPDQARMLLHKSDVADDHKFEVVEYVDDEQYVMGVLGEDGCKPGDWETSGSSRVQQLERMDNPTGMCLAVVPRRITLDRLQGQFDGAIGMYQMQAKLMALAVIAVQKGVLPEQWVVARQNEIPEIISVPDMKSGAPGVIKGGDINTVQVPPGFMTSPMLDRIESYLRADASVPSDFSGEAASTVRTGRRADQLLSAAVDFTIQEAQEVLAESLQEENRRAVAVAKWMKKPASFHVGWKGAKGQVDYDPIRDFRTDANTVKYAQAGADIQSLVVGIGQRIGLGTMSKRTGMEIDPLVEDPEKEHDRIIQEGLEMALLQSVQTQAADPNGPYQPDDLAFITEQVFSSSEPLFKAVQLAQQRAQERQATPAPTGAPETMPGLAPPGMGAEQPAIAPPGPSMGNLQQLLSQLHSTGQAA